MQKKPLWFLLHYFFIRRPPAVRITRWRSFLDRCPATVDIKEGVGWRRLPERSRLLRNKLSWTDTFSFSFWFSKHLPRSGHNSPGSWKWGMGIARHQSTPLSSETIHLWRRETNSISVTMTATASWCSVNGSWTLTNGHWSGHNTREMWKMPIT